MEESRNSSVPSSVTARSMPRNLGVYTRSFGIPPSDRSEPGEEERSGSGLGFDSPLIALLPARSADLSPADGTPPTDPAPAGFEFFFGTSGSESAEEFFTFVQAMGLTVIRDPHRPTDGE